MCILSFEEVNILGNIINDSDVDDYYTKIIIPYNNNLNEESSIAYIIIGNYIKDTIDLTIDKIEKFINQIQNIIDKIKPKFEEINQIQEDINELYAIESDLLERLFKDKYSTPRNGDYLYKMIFLKSIKQKNGGDVYHNIFTKKYLPYDKYSIEGENINRLEEIIESSFSDKKGGMEDVLNTLKQTTYRFSLSEDLENKICVLLGLNPKILNFDGFDFEIEDEQLPIELNTDDIDRKYNTAIDIKNDYDSDFIDEIFKENNLPPRWADLEDEKNIIDSTEKYDKYLKHLKDYFNELYEIITAPGVKKIIDWIREIDNRGAISTKKYKWLEIHLLDQYSEYREEIESILRSISLLDNIKGGLFNGVKKKIKDNVIKVLKNYNEDDNEEFNQDLAEFIDDFHSLLKTISEVEEINFVDVKQFYTDVDIDLTENETKIIDEETDFYFEVINKVVKANDEITTDQSQVTIKNIPELVECNIDDIKKSIDLLKGLNIFSEADNHIHNLYNKFEKSILFKSAGKCSDKINEEIDQTWNTIKDDYYFIKYFYDSYENQYVQSLLILKDRWESINFPPKIEKYLIGVKTLLNEQPFDIILSKEIEDIGKQFKKTHREVDDLKEPELIDEIIEYCDICIKVDIENKIKVLKKIIADDDELQNIRGSLQFVQSFSENLPKLDNDENLLTYLEETFSGFITKVIEIREKTSKLIEGSLDKETHTFFEDFDTMGNGVDIDEEFDFLVAEKLMENRLTKTSF